ncbi:MAG: glycosyltransferase family 9 protein, partial [Succinivibrio sp.]
MTARDSKSACVLRLTALGDCVNCFGMLCAMKAAEPEARLEWIIDQRFAPLFRDAKGNDIIPMVPLDFSRGVARAVLQARKALSGFRFDALLDMQTSLKASLVSLAVRAGERFGYDAERSREGQFMFINRKVPSPPNPHVLAGFMAFAKAAGFGDLQPRWDFRISPEEAAPYLALSSDRPLFTIAPASAKPQKNWSPEGYAALADYASGHGFKVVLAGSRSKADLMLCERIS